MRSQRLIQGLLVAAAIATIAMWLETSKWLHTAVGAVWSIPDPSLLIVLFNFALIGAIYLLYRRTVLERSEPASTQYFHEHITVQRNPEESVPTIRLSTEWGIPRLRVNLAVYNAADIDVTLDRTVVRVEEVDLTIYDQFAPHGPRPTFLLLDRSLTMEQAQHLRELAEKKQSARITVSSRLETSQGGTIRLSFREWAAPVTLAAS